MATLEEIGYEDVRYAKGRRELRFSRSPGHNPTGVKMDIYTLRYRCFSTNEKGNLYSLVMKAKNVSFPDSLHYISKFLGLSESEFEYNVQLPFGGFYKEIIRDSIEPECNMQTYSSSVLEDYEKKYSLLFLYDGIGFKTQKKYRLGYDRETDRITIPIWTFDDRLCGIMGRLNDPDCEKGERWYPIISCSRSLTLAGYTLNYQQIQEKGMAVIGESEKFPMQLDSFGCQIGLATSGCAISGIQAKYIKGMMIPKIVLAYDEGLDQDQVRNEAEKLKANTTIYTNQVGYVWDENNEILQKGSKMSPSDLGKAKFFELMKNYVRWI